MIDFSFLPLLIFVSGNSSNTAINIRIIYVNKALYIAVKLTIKLIYFVNRCRDKTEQLKEIKFYMRQIIK